MKSDIKNELELLLTKVNDIGRSLWRNGKTK